MPGSLVVVRASKRTAKGLLGRSCEFSGAKEWVLPILSHVLTWSLLCRTARRGAAGAVHQPPCAAALPSWNPSPGVAAAAKKVDIRWSLGQLQVSRAVQQRLPEQVMVWGSSGRTSARPLQA